MRLIGLTRIHKRRSNDVSLGRAPHEVERETGDEGQRRCFGRSQDVGIFWIYDLGVFDNILVGPSAKVEKNDIVNTDVFQSAKISVAMSGDTKIAGMPHTRRALNAISVGARGGTCVRT